MNTTKTAPMIVVFMSVIALILCGPIASTSAAPTPDAEKTIWDLEHSYWRLVEANDLPAYRNLWHADFLGWPSMNAEPVHKDHITDWITSQTSTEHTFKLIEFKPAAIQSSGSTVVVCYWTTYKWIDKSGQGDEHSVRVTHTWIKNGNDWQIVGGMSMAISTSPQK
jgi:ketosteroid isomerase-like protein